VVDRAAIRVDVIYTLLHRLGLFKLAMFFTVENWLTDGIGVLRAHGMPTLQLDALWPGVTDRALVSFVIYLLVFDFIGYWVHRAQHQWDWWWRLHAVHHSQRQMTMWSDNRNHLLDSALNDAIFVAVAIAIGVAPRSSWGWWPSPSCSKACSTPTCAAPSAAWPSACWSARAFTGATMPSASGTRPAQPASRAPPGRPARAPPGGSEPRAAGSVGANIRGVNFGVLFSCWDALLGSADWAGGREPTGIRDQVEQGRDYGRGFWAQQWLGLKRLAGRDGVAG
jgi:sterol desaturase/sphingolipid hydroxylase (fatty acid hydroxylase superfamily)